MPASLIRAYVNSNEKLMLFVYMHNSCTRNADHLSLSIKTGNVDKERMLSQTIIHPV